MRKIHPLYVATLTATARKMYNKTPKQMKKLPYHKFKSTKSDFEQQNI